MITKSSRHYEIKTFYRVLATQLYICITIFNLILGKVLDFGLIWAIK